jgi:UDP-glucose 4-epimerase
MIAPGARGLVTGGAGFIGPHLVQRLLDEECSVVILDNFVTGRRAHLEAYRGNDGVTVVECDLRDRDQTIAVVTGVRPDIVVHLAAHQVIPFCVANPAEALRVNVLGTQHLLDAVARTDSCQRFLLASTAGVYAPSERPHTESDPLAAGDVYGASKRLSEELVAFAANQCPTVRFLVARFFNVYGPGETSAHLIPEILEALAAGKAVPLGNLESRRDYVYVTDVVDALIRLGQYTGPRSMFNVGTGLGWSAMDIVHLLEIILKRHIDVEVDPGRVRRSDRPSLVADTTLASVDLRWTAKIALDAGLRRTLAMTSIRAAG